MRVVFFQDYFSFLLSDSNALLENKPDSWKYFLQAFYNTFHEQLTYFAREFISIHDNVYFKQNKDLPVESKNALKLSKKNLGNTQKLKIFSRQLAAFVLLYRLKELTSENLPAFVKDIVFSRVHGTNRLAQILVARKFFLTYVQPVFVDLVRTSKIPSVEIFSALKLVKRIYYLEVLRNGLHSAIDLLKNANQLYSKLQRLIDPASMVIWETSSKLTLPDDVKQIAPNEIQNHFTVQSNLPQQLHMSVSEEKLKTYKAIAEHVSFGLKDITYEQLEPLYHYFITRFQDLLLQSANSFIGGFISTIFEEFAKTFFDTETLDYTMYQTKLDLVERFQSLLAFSSDEIVYACNSSDSTEELAYNLYQVILRKAKKIQLDKTIDKLLVPVKRLGNSLLYEALREAIKNFFLDDNVFQFLLGTQASIVHNLFLILAEELDAFAADALSALQFGLSYEQNVISIARNKLLQNSDISLDSNALDALQQEGVVANLVSSALSVPEQYDWAAIKTHTQITKVKFTRSTKRVATKIKVSHGTQTTLQHTHPKLQTHPSSFNQAASCSLLQIGGIDTAYPTQFDDSVTDTVYDNLGPTTPTLQVCANVSESEVTSFLNTGTFTSNQTEELPLLPETQQAEVQQATTGTAQLTYQGVSPAQQTGAGQPSLLEQVITTDGSTQSRGSITNSDASRDWFQDFLNTLLNILSMINTILDLLSALMNLLKKGEQSTVLDQLAKKPPCQKQPGIFGVVKPSLIYHPSLQEAAIHYIDQFLRENYFLKVRPVTLSRKDISKMPYFAFKTAPIEPDTYWEKVLKPVLDTAGLTEQLNNALGGNTCVKPPYYFMLDNVTVNMSHSNEFGASFIQRLTSLLSTTAKQWIQLYSNPAEVYNKVTSLFSSQKTTGKTQSTANTYLNQIKELFAGLSNYLPQSVQAQYEQFAEILQNVLTGSKFDAPKVFNASSSNFTIDASIYLIAEIPEPAVVLYKILLPLIILWSLSIPKTLDLEIKLAKGKPKTKFPQLYYTWPFYWEIELWRGLPNDQNLNVQKFGFKSAPEKYSQAHGKLLFWHPAMAITNLQMQLSNETARYRASDIVAVKVNFTLVPLYSTVFGAFDQNSSKTAMLTFGWLVKNLKNMILPPKPDITCKS